MRARVSSDLFINKTKCVITSPLHLFPEIFDENWWLYFQRTEPSYKFSSFEYKILTFSRNVSNQLHINVISYNRKKCRLFIPLWKPKTWRNFKNLSLNSFDTVVFSTRNALQWIRTHAAGWHKTTVTSHHTIWKTWHQPAKFH